MSTEETVVTDSNNVENEETNVVENDNVENTTEKPSRYEVVFFARYHTNPRPSSDDVTKYFSNYGTVDHVNCPEGRNYAFVFMASLNTTAEHRRTRSTISQIISDMTPENRFHITVASSNRVGYSRQNNYPQHPSNYRQPRQYNNNYDQRYPPRYDNRQSGRGYGRDNHDQNGYDQNRVQNRYDQNGYDQNRVQNRPDQNGDQNRSPRRPYTRNQGSTRPAPGSYQFREYTGDQRQYSVRRPATRGQ